jgi:hypothetical protein
MKKKLMAVLLSTAMTATMLIGCGSTDTASSAPAATSAAAAEAQSQAADAATSVAAAADASTETASAASSTTYAMDKSWPKETVKIGFEAYDTTDEQFLAFQSYLEYLTQILQRIIHVFREHRIGGR